jgi:hypothetical protein
MLGNCENVVNLSASHCVREIRMVMTSFNNCAKRLGFVSV